MNVCSVLFLIQSYTHSDLFQFKLIPEYFRAQWRISREEQLLESSTLTPDLTPYVPPDVSLHQLYIWARKPPLTNRGDELVLLKNLEGNLKIARI